MSLDGWHLEEAERAKLHGLAGAEGTGIDPLVRAVQDVRKFEHDTKIHNYTVSEGLDTGHKGGHRLAGYSKAGGAAGESEKQKAERRAFEEAVLHALQSGDFGSFVADQVFDPKSDAEIEALVEHIENVTGGTLEEYAAGILGPQEAQQGPFESDADYRRRIVKAVTAQIVDPDSDPATGIKIKPQYADDPLAQYLYGDELFRQAENALKEGASMQDVAEHGYGSADTGAAVVKEEDAVNSAKVVQDDQREAAVSDGSDLTDNADIFGTIGKPSAAEKASKAGVAEFNKVAVNTGSAPEVVASPHPLPGLG